MTTPAPTCPYCGHPSRYLATSETLYRGRDFGPAYACFPCGAWVGVHIGTDKPKGSLANLQLRALRMDVHALFDPLWQDLSHAYPEFDRVPGPIRRLARMRAYAYLAALLSMPVEHCHIGMFREAVCRRTIGILNEIQPTSATVRAWAKANPLPRHITAAEPIERKPA